MPLPLIIGIAAAATGITGIGSGIHGGMKLKEANETMKLAEEMHEENIECFEKQSKKTSKQMDKVGKKELEILNSFEKFTQVFEKIDNKPIFKTFDNTGVELPQYSAEELKDVSVAAGLLLGGLGGAAVGTAGGFAAAGATTAAVMTLGTASTGTAIASLSGVAATNATLAALGGGSIAAGGGGIALGSAILGGATLGVGLLVGGIVFNITGSSLSNKADEAWSQMKKAEDEINKICIYLKDLFKYSKKFHVTLVKVDKLYIEYLERLCTIIEVDGKTNWNMFTTEEKLITENTVLLVALLFNMCKVKLVLTSKNETDLNKINYAEIEESIEDANKIILNIN